MKSLCSGADLVGDGGSDFGSVTEIVCHVSHIKLVTGVVGLKKVQEKGILRPIVLKISK